MTLRLRTRGFKLIKNPNPPLTQIFTSDQIVLEFSKNNWSDSWHRVGYVRALAREGGKFIQLGPSRVVIFGKQKITLEVSPADSYQIQIELVPWLPWVYCRLWEVIPESPP